MARGGFMPYRDYRKESGKNRKCWHIIPTGISGLTVCGKPTQTMTHSIWTDEPPELWPEGPHKICKKCAGNK